ncbi:hypothetical protein [Taibaiella soli]|uniref:Uncharacterized protein n=1 Tax=Taibaiella soli TaxID=1649169 RepID=A0A2W2AXR7_9BACT|nr:hypothetical protein [Taibaiella soli]PZF72468.1 hypothetical protein DN068_14065 [Taibaiella soli]
MNNNQKAVRLKTSVLIDGEAAQKEPAHLNFLPMGDFNPTATAYGVTDEQNQKLLNKFFEYMKSIDSRVFSWLEADANNAILFANDPLRAIKIAIPDFDESVITGLNKEMLM